MIKRLLIFILLCTVTVACNATQESAPTATETAAPAATIAPAQQTATEAPVATNTAVPANPTVETNTTTEAAPSSSETWQEAWMLNPTGETSAIFTGIPVNVTAVNTTEIDGNTYQCIETTGIPNYETIITQEIIDSLNGRPLAARDFTNGTTTATVGQTVLFGENIGYDPAMGCTEGSEGYGYWPFGPTCPSDQSKTQCFALEPEPANNVCYTGISTIGSWVNGVSIFNWTDGMSYNGERVWQHEAYHFEFYDLDICPGHSAMGDYHHHSNPVCLAEQLEDTGNEHSPIYGFAADGYPIHGPWHDEGELVSSCWRTRDYDDPNSETGCGVAGERSCLLVDQFDITKGTTPASSNGPNTSDVVQSASGNEFVATSGYYFQDYYYDPTCTAQGITYLDEHNGHDHDGLGYHYHVTVAESEDGTLVDVFPFYIGPTFAGTLPDNAVAACNASTNFGGPGGGPGGGNGGPNGNNGGPGGGGNGQGNGGGVNFAAIAEALGISEDEFRDALGPPPPDFEAAAATLGISWEEMQAALESTGIQIQP